MLNGRIGKRKDYIMYELVDEAEVKRYKSFCSNTLSQLRDIVKNNYEIKLQPLLVGSGARNLVTRNGNGPFDLDYNLEIINMSDKYWNDLFSLKNNIMLSLNKIVNNTYFSDSKDSKSVITSLLHFNDSPQLKFSFDIAIIAKNDKGNYCRLIHEKDPYSKGRFYWNEVPASNQVGKKATKLKHDNHWLEVRNRYVELKNQYLLRNDNNHPSFTVYVETLNEIYNKYYAVKKK